MPYTFRPFAIKLEEFKKVRGSGDEALVDAVATSDDVPDDDDDPDDYEVLDDDEEEEESESLPTSREALRHIVMGEPYARGIGFKYAYMALEICAHLGEKLPNDLWGQTRAEFVEAFDRFLNKLGVPKSVLRLETHFWSRPDPIELPPRSDFPSIGHLTLKECRATLDALSALAPEAINKAGTGLKTSRGAIDPVFFKDCLEEIKGWCAACVESGRDLVVFYH